MAEKDIERIMIKRTRQSGFSLLEVMMAVVVMTMGMVFVASMFPVGLYNARKTADATMNAIELNNSVVSAGLVVDAAIKTGLTGRGNCFEFRDAPNDVNSNDVYDSGNGEEGNPNSIHFLIKPNVLADSVGTNSPIVVVDDIEYVLLPGANPQNQFWYSMNPPTIAYTGAPYSGASLFMATYFEVSTTIIPIIDGTGGYYDPYDSGDYVDDYLSPELTTGSFIGDIGFVASPPVFYTDQDVLDRIEKLSGDTQAVNLASVVQQQVVNRAVYDVTMERNYSWAAFYEGTGKPEFMYIFTLKNHQRNVRYAVQDPASMVYNNPVDPIFDGDRTTTPTYGSTGPLPYARGSAYDRHFPVPWLVHMDVPKVSAFARRQAPYYDHILSVSAEIAKILRPGSILLNADPDGVDSRDSTKVYVNHDKMIYEVEDVVPIDPTDLSVGFNVILTDTLGDSVDGASMFAFWVFPPAINRATNEYEDEQPVVDVVYRKVEW